ncbi:copper transport protein ATX1-like [Silene latifolia]|uniref:copper transport protein ATX1-like n=1 Tax=Silene latifolia TaxID=37657 RepID=UPI003D76C603
MSEIVVLKVKISCTGCSGAVKRVLDKMEGVESYDINMEEQKVTVKGNIKSEAVLETVSKTGKKTELWEETIAAESESVVLDVEPTGTKTEMDPSQLTETETKPTEEVEIETKSTEVLETETKQTTTVEAS